MFAVNERCRSRSFSIFSSSFGIRHSFRFSFVRSIYLLHYHKIKSIFQNWPKSSLFSVVLRFSFSVDGRREGRQQTENNFKPINRFYEHVHRIKENSFHEKDEKWLLFFVVKRKEWFCCTWNSIWYMKYCKNGQMIFKLYQFSDPNNKTLSKNE